MNTFDPTENRPAEPSDGQDLPIIEIKPCPNPEPESADAAADTSKENPKRTAVGQAGSVGKVVAGAALAAIGVPMLVLPGPGIAAIAVGGLIAAKGASELTGKENPVITQIEDHPDYRAAAQKAKNATNTVTGAVADAAKEVPGVVAGAGKAVIDAVDNNLPDNVRNAVDNAKPVVKNAVDATAPVVQAAGKGINAGLKTLGRIAKDIRQGK